MKILVACEESQAVTIELRKLGHEAYSCDIEPCSGGHPEWHLQQDVIPLLQQKWDMIIAFPPCTYLSNAGACRLYPQKGKLNIDRYKKGLKAKQFFMQFYNADCQKIAIENPVSSKIFNMPEYTQEIQPYMFGHPCTKKTRLWLKGLPKLVSTNVVDPIAPYVPAGTSRKNRKKYGLAKRGDDAKNRAKTFTGIAKAMAEQWAGKSEK
ncbi:hypothetical protein [Megasphaera sueciensis]|uniref:hypothetical protein n=1 Tax=Megasphaera sueciensis TaxID=349094 RepID=UPI003D02094F